MNPRIFGAFVIGGALVFGAYTLSDFGKSEAQLAVGDPTISVVAGDAPARSYISTNDQNNDGVPDWQEALRTTDPLILDALGTSTYEFSETVTDEFAREFFERVVRAKGYGPAGSSNDEIVNSSIEKLTSQATLKLLTFDDIIISSSNGTEDIFTYGNQVGAIINSYTSDSVNSEAEILLEAVRSNNEDLLQDLDQIEANYQGVINDLKTLPVPSTYAREHLNLLNSLKAIHEDVAVFQGAFTDPMLTMLHTKRYQDDLLGLNASLKNIIVKIVDEGMYYPDRSYPGFILMAFYPLEE